MSEILGYLSVGLLEAWASPAVPGAGVDLPAAAPRCRSAADMGGVAEPVPGEAGVAVDADAGGFAAGER